MSGEHPSTNARFPVAVGGVGGSGTRVVADILGDFGYFLGGDLNKSKDNLWYTLLFKRRNIAAATHEQIALLAQAFSSAMSGKVFEDRVAFGVIDELAARDSWEFSRDDLSQLSMSLSQALRYGKPFEYWAWKEPNTHVLIEHLAEHIPNLRYVHVIRDGRDMAFSTNKNQLHYWADTYFQLTDFDPNLPSDALLYWRLANERISRLRENGTLPVLEVGYECLCERPVEQILEIAKFCNHPLSQQQARDIGARTVRPSPTIGRYREMDCSSLKPDDVRYAGETKARLFRELEQHSRRLLR